MDYHEALDLLSDDDVFRSTVAAMNALLMKKGIYTHQEFEAYFIQSAQAKIRKAAKAANNPEISRRSEIA